VTLTPVARVALNLVLSLVCAVAAFRWVEEPARRRLRDAARRRSRPSAAPAPAVLDVVADPLAAELAPVSGAG
jgi:peptidoglycan/LPS O-acetylase OafA/YrhL